MPQRPATPPHVQPDEEVNLPQGMAPVDLQLNPELDDEEDSEQTGREEKDASTQPTTASEPELRRADAETQMSDLDGWSVGDLWTLPFDDAYSLLKANFNLSKKHASVLLSQQSRFITYVDQQLLNIQRNFIRNQSDSAFSYTLNQLLTDLDPVIALLWHLFQETRTLFGQDEYLIKILGDLDDWTAYYTFPNSSDILFYVKLFGFFQNLDTRVCFMIDGTEENGQPLKMSATEVVRLAPIVNRLRVNVISKLDVRGGGLAKIAQMFNTEIGQLFEGLLDRI